MTKEIPISRGLVTVVDDEDYERLSAFRWSAVQGRRGLFYASRRVLPAEGLGIQTRQMQRDVLDPRGEVPSTLLADHINRDPLDNRRSNLRWADYSLSNKNREMSIRKTSRFRGVHFCNNTQRFIATLIIDGRVNRRKCHTEEDAAHAYDAFALQCLGDEAQLNFPDAAHAEIAARRRVTELCDRLRARNDSDVLLAARMIEVAVQAIAAASGDPRYLKSALSELKSAYRDLARAPQEPSEISRRAA